MPSRALALRRSAATAMASRSLILSAAMLSRFLALRRLMMVALASIAGCAGLSWAMDGGDGLLCGCAYKKCVL